MPFWGGRNNPKNQISIQAGRYWLNMNSHKLFNIVSLEVIKVKSKILLSDHFHCDLISKTFFQGFLCVFVILYPLKDGAINYIVGYEVNGYFVSSYMSI